MSGGWNAVWERRQAPPPGGSILARLMAAGGLDSGFAHVAEAEFRAFVARAARDLVLQPGESVFDVGCGAGAFLYELARGGHPVGGIDRSPASVELARETLPEGEFAVADAATLDTALRFDVVVSNGVFLYFPSHGYAQDVLARMTAKARRAVALFDVPDAALEAETLAYRVAAAGGKAAYAARYAELEHRYYDREWVRAELTRGGLVDVRSPTRRRMCYK